ncbi:LolA family protein [Maritalea sp.]|jgi:outer membrane lipoprotein-sorting protein|uniref:LolA family protein n=1 Tax=Maritalea sp. TaxID=2003361 RepID=UPI0039E253B2
MRLFFKTLLAFLIAIGLTMPIQALDRALTEEEIQIINDISAHHSAVEQMAGRFLQLDSAGNRSEGIFYLKRPNKIRFKYAPPSYEEVISVGSGFYVINRKEKSKFAYPQQRVPLRQFLSDNIDLFAANITDVVKTEEMIAVTVADDTPAGPVSVTMIFNLETKDIQQWTLTEPNGNEVTFSIYDTTTEIDIPKAYFYLPDYNN